MTTTMLDMFTFFIVFLFVGGTICLVLLYYVFVGIAEELEGK